MQIKTYGYEVPYVVIVASSDCPEGGECE